MGSRRWHLVIKGAIACGLPNTTAVRTTKQNDKVTCAACMSHLGQSEQSRIERKREWDSMNKEQRKWYLEGWMTGIPDDIGDGARCAMEDEFSELARGER